MGAMDEAALKLVVRHDLQVEIRALESAKERAASVAAGLGAVGRPAQAAGARHVAQALERMAREARERLAAMREG